MGGFGPLHTLRGHMATTNIELDIENITGVADADDQFIVSAQKFVVASVPKELLMFALNRSSISSDGSAMTVENDSIVDVQRNGYSCKEVPFSESVWATDSGSLKKATASFPVYWIQNDGVKIAPVTDGSNGGYVFYINSPEIDDDSDLRNIVINYATSKEFTQLAAASTFPTLTWNTEVPPSAPSSPSFTTPDIATVTAPTFTPPVMNSLDFTDTNNWISTEEDSEMLASRVQEIQSKIGEFSALLQSAQADFNRNNAEYQALVQEAQQEASLLTNQESQEYSAKLQKYQAELQEYQARVNETVQINQGQIAEWQAENGIKLNHYVQLATQYYNWALAEIKTYIENNPKTFDKVMEMQKGK